MVISDFKGGAIIPQIGKDVNTSLGFGNQGGLSISSCATGIAVADAERTGTRPGISGEGTREAL